MKMYKIAYNYNLIESEVTLLSESEFSSVVDGIEYRYMGSSPKENGFSFDELSLVRNLIEIHKEHINEAKLELRNHEDKLERLMEKYSNKL